MRNDKAQAITLRRRGKSYNQISTILHVAKSTLNYWFKHEEWSDKIKNKLVKRSKQWAAKRMKILSLKAKEKRLESYQTMRKEAARVYKIFSKESLFLEGLMLYWGEGDNKVENGQLRVANTNPLLIKNFHLFIKRYLPLAAGKVRMYLVLYPGLNENKCKNYWAKIVGLPLDNFYKSQYIKGRSAKRKIKFGIGTIIISSRAYKEMLMRWLELKKREIEKVRM